MVFYILSVGAVLDYNDIGNIYMKKILLATVAAFAVAMTMATPTLADNWSGNYVGGSLNTSLDTVGAYVGHRYDLGTVVLGVEGGVNYSTVTSATTATIEGAVGYDFGPFLPYVSGGWTHTGVQSYGVGLDYQLGAATVLGAKWNNTGGSYSVGARISFNF
jgi:hypothetical protein